MTQTTAAPRPSIAELRAAYQERVRATFAPKVPGLPGDGTPVILHTDTERGLTYTWYDRSTDIQDAGPRQSGLETSLLAVTHGEHRVAYLRVSFSTKELLAETFASPFEWADENTGASFGFGFTRRHGGDQPADAKIWATAHDDLGLSPASWGGKRPAGACSWRIDPKDAPTDEATLAADLKVAAAQYRKQMRGFLNTYRHPFVAYAHVDDVWDAQKAGEGHPGPLRGTGIGRTMYLLAAQHLATTERMLIASDIQTDHADRLWQRLIADPTVPTRQARKTYYRTGQVKTYWCLDYRGRITG